MRLSSLALTAILCISSTQSASIPSPNPPLPALPITISPRVRPGEWDYPIQDTAIRLLGTIGSAVASSVFASICAATSQFLHRAIDAQGGEDALIPHGMFIYQEFQTHMVIQLRNANNHQLTWKVVKATVNALTKVPELERRYQTDFKIFDGANQVGTGFLTYMS